MSGEEATTDLLDIRSDLPGWGSHKSQPATNPCRSIEGLLEQWPLDYLVTSTLPSSACPTWLEGGIFHFNVKMAVFTSFQV